MLRTLEWYQDAYKRCSEHNKKRIYAINMDIDSTIKTVYHNNFTKKQITEAVREKRGRYDSFCYRKDLADEHYKEMVKRINKIQRLVAALIEHDTIAVPEVQVGKDE